MESRRPTSFHLGPKSPSIKSCFPETKSIEGSDYKPEKRPSKHAKAQSLDVDDRLSSAFASKKISYQDNSPFNVQPSSSLVFYNNALYNNLPSRSDSLHMPLTEIQNFNSLPNITSGSGSKETGKGKISMLQNQNLKSVVRPGGLARQASNICPQQPMLPQSQYAIPTLAKGVNSGNLKNHTRHVPLYLAALRGDWKTAKAYLQLHPHAVRATITMGSETVLHIAAGARHTRFVRQLVKRMTPDDLAMQNKAGNTALCFAAASGITEIAKILVTKNRNLPLVRGSRGATPLYMAVLLGKRDMVWYLYSVINDKDLSGEDRVGLLIAAITSNLFDVALALIRNHPDLAVARDGNGETALHVLSRKPGAFYSGSKLGFWKRCIYSCLQVAVQDDFCSRPADDDHLLGLIKQVLPTSKSFLWNCLFCLVPESKMMYKLKLQHMQALELVKQLWQQILHLDDTDVKDLIRTPKRLLFTAAKYGIVEFTTILIHSYPDLIWKVDEQSKSIFHTAIEHRQEKVFNLIHEIGALKDFIAIYRDDANNNMLHLVGKLPDASRLNTDSGAALQLRRELLWFKEVEKIVQPLYTEMENSDGKTPHCLFSIEHKRLLREGEKWMKNTASSCMVVATLIATVMFAAAFTVPGGNNDKGLPVFLNKRSFLVFIVSDAVALFSSSTSILIFLSILTSRYAEEDFLRSLPNKLVMGLATLFISIAAMMIAFSFTLFIVLGHGLELTTIPIAVVACVPVLMFASLQFPLVIDIIRHTHRSKNFFRPRNHLLT